MVKIIFCSTNSENNLVKQTYEHTLGGKIKAVSEKILMKKELWQKQILRICVRSAAKVSIRRWIKKTYIVNIIIVTFTYSILVNLKDKNLKMQKSFFWVCGESNAFLEENSKIAYINKNWMRDNLLPRKHQNRWRRPKEAAGVWKR